MIAPILTPKLGMTQADITVVKWEKVNGEPIENGALAVTI